MMDLDKLIGDSYEEVLPESIRKFIQYYVEGKIRSYMIVGHLEEDQVFDCYDMGKESNVYTMIGALEVLKRDFMRDWVKSRIEYRRADDEDD